MSLHKSRLCQFYRWRVFPSSFALSNSLFRAKGPSARKETGLFQTLSSMPVLPHWTYVASMEVLFGSFTQRICFKTVLKKAVHVYVLRREEPCSTSGFDGLQRYSIRTAQVRTNSGCHHPTVKRFWRKSIVRHSVGTMTSKRSLLIGVPGCI